MLMMMTTTMTITQWTEYDCIGSLPNEPKGTKKHFSTTKKHDHERKAQKDTFVF